MSQAEFAGTKRYTPTRLLGAGSWGRVYQAYDAERNAFVAVKLLQRPSADALIRFKREFRSLQDLVHPNLVTLYELLSDKDQWFFIMELVDGKNFLEHVHGRTSGADDGSAGAAPTINERLPSMHQSTATIDPETLAPKPRPPAANGAERGPLSAASIARLRDALGQLVEGLSALHAAGKLHRDVKPTNVLVAKDGRVVLLDFGLVHELSEPDEKLNKGLVVGTPAYMSPEQAGGLKLDEASDWYAVGVLLHEALTGHVPFEGPSSQMLKARRTEDPVPPSRLARGVPDDLDALCLQLLAREPQKRPKGPELLERFKRRGTLARSDALLPLFGREPELEALRAAHRWVREKKAPALVTLEGASGLGKTALLDAFLTEVRANDPAALVLHGTCGERESVPFKAFDGAIDALTSQLASWPVPVLKPLIPKDFRSLMRLFPVLERLKTAVPEGAADAPKDPLEIRRRAFGALKALIAVLARQRTVVLALDDLHFGDEDSAALLARLLEGPALPPLLTLGTFRTRDDAAKEPEGAVRALDDAAFAAAGARDVLLTRLVLAPLDEGPSRTMAIAHGAPLERVDAVVREAGGNPMLLGQLAAVAGEGAATLADWAAAHLSRLSAPARRLLEVVAVAQRPVDRMVAWHAARLDTEAADPSMQLLAARLAATDGQRLWVYQRDVGRAVRSAIPEDEQKRLLAALADALATSPKADFESVADWAAGAGQVLRASVALEHAAEGAEKVLAFERAAKLYERALSGRPAEEVARLQKRRAAALASSGHGKQAAAIYLQLASTSERTEALALRQLAAEQLLYCGHVDAGVAVMSEVLAALGEPMPRTQTLQRVWAVVSRMRVELHGLKFDIKPREAWESAALQRTDAYWAAAKGFSLVDPVRGTTFQFTHFRHALDCGDPYRIARALALEAGFHALMGVRHQKACHQALTLLAGVLRDHPNDHAEGLSELMAGSAALGLGRFTEARRHFEYAVGIFEEKCPGMTWEISSSLQYLAYALTNLGEYEQVVGWMNEVREWAQARGDTYALTNFRVRVGPMVRLMLDDAGAAKNEIGAALQEFSRAGYYTQHLWGYFGTIAALLYEGRDAEAVEREQAEWPKIRGSGMMRIQFTRVLVGYVRGQLTALNPAAPVTAITRLARLLEGEGIPWANGLARLLHAAAAVRGGQVALALEHLDEGARLLEETGARTHAVAARRAAAELRGLPGDADGWLTSRGVRRPDRFARAFFALPSGLR